ncbi:MAG: DUF2997 domain-containing protein [Microbacterium sp.]
MVKQLIVSLRPDGTVAAETAGMAGDECLTYISALEDLLDATTTQSAFTADYASTHVDAGLAQTQQDRR